MTRPGRARRVGTLALLSFGLLGLAKPALAVRMPAPGAAGGPPPPVATAQSGQVRVADVLVTAGRTLSASVIRAVRRIRGVRAVETVDYGRLRIAGNRANAFGVDPASFRWYTPRLSARSNALWNDVVRGGQLTVSFDMGHNARLPLGGRVPVSAQRGARMRIGAFATVGYPDVDAVVSKSRARALGLPTDNAIIISAPRVDPAVLRGELRAVLPAGAQVEVLREVVVVRQAGEFLTNVQLVRVLRAAQSRLGDRYVWGAVGPNTFDCSGLVGWSYAQAGISLPRTSEQQWFAGVHVPVREMRPGDLLFWHYDPTDPADIDHVALYIGRGMMIVAPHTGTVVQVQPVYSADFAGVVRVDPKVAAQVGGPRFAVAATPS